jgi:hypothetical protein
MGKLHERMQKDLPLEAYSPHTQRAYLGWARHFACLFLRSPAEMGEQEIRGFLLHLVRYRRAYPATLSPVAGRPGSKYPCLHAPLRPHPSRPPNQTQSPFIESPWPKIALNPPKSQA